MWAHTEGLTPLYLGGSFLTIAVQGLTEADKPRAEERRGRGEQQEERTQGMAAWS